MDIIFIFNEMSGGNGFDLLQFIGFGLMGVYAIYGEIKLRGSEK